jgi:hypothetical protein
LSGQKGGQKTGKNPTDRGKRGSKHHVLVDRWGLPLAVGLTAANVSDPTTLEAMVDAVPPIRGKRGRPRRRPDKLHADKAYNSVANRAALRRRHILPRLARNLNSRPIMGSVPDLMHQGEAVSSVSR